MVDCAVVACVTCGRAIRTYPPEDGHDSQWRCGHCAHNALAVRVT